MQSIHEATVNRKQALRKERDERLQQMAKLQQDIANMPQEAVNEIVGGDYGLGEWGTTWWMEGSWSIGG